MNERIRSIVEDMEKETHNPGENPLVSLMRMSSKMAQLLFLLAEESERQSNKISEQTEKLIQYTKTIRILTYALLFLGGIQLLAFFLKR